MDKETQYQTPKTDVEYLEIQNLLCESAGAGNEDYGEIDYEW